jgi:hypothetical protein
MEFAKCLKCGNSEIEPEEIIDEWISDDGTKVITTVVGQCPKCKENCMWDEVYEFSTV